MIQVEDVLLGHLARVAWCADIDDSLFCQSGNVFFLNTQFGEVLWDAYSFDRSSIALQAASAASSTVMPS